MQQQVRNEGFTSSLGVATSARRAARWQLSCSHVSEPVATQATCHGGEFVPKQATTTGMRLVNRRTWRRGFHRRRRKLDRQPLPRRCRFYLHGGSGPATNRSQQCHFMSDKKAMERAAEDRRDGKAATTQAGEFAEIPHLRSSTHGAQCRRRGDARRRPRRRSSAKGRATASAASPKRQAQSAAAKRTAGARSAAVCRAARTKGPLGRSAAARKAARTRAHSSH